MRLCAEGLMKRPKLHHLCLLLACGCVSLLGCKGQIAVSDQTAPNGETTGQDQHRWLIRLPAHVRARAIAKVVKDAD